MVMHRKVDNVKNQMNNLIIKFYNMSPEERIHYIKRYERMSSMEQVALIQSRKFMSSNEKKEYKKVKENYAQKLEEQAQCTK